MSRAVKLIRESDIPISEIISGVGYENASYFHREFKKRYGKSPLAVRKENE
jgi:AraC-like DNA-binding protein